MQHIIVLSDEIDQQANMLAERFGISLEELMNRAIANFAEQERIKMMTPKKQDQWSEGFFESVFGSCADVPLERPPQLELETRLEFK